MTPLRVGDVRIDGSRVTIGSPAGGRAEPAAAGPVHAEDAAGTLARWARAVPVSAAFLCAAGLALAAAGTAFNVLLRAQAGTLGALAQGGFLAPVGAGLLVLAGAKRLLARSPRLLHRTALGSGAAGYAATLRDLLRREDPRQTVPWIVGRTGWPEARVVHALALLRADGQVEEKLDLASGQFHYCSAALAPDPRSLDTRIESLTD